MLESKHIPFEEIHEHEKGFSEYYENQIVPKVAEVEKNRLRKLSKDKLGNIIAWSGWIIWFIGTVILIFTSFDVLIFLVLTLVSFLLTSTFADEPTYPVPNSYQNHFEKQILPLAIKFFGDFTFKAEGETIPGRYLGHYDITMKYTHNRFEKKNYIKGEFKTIKFEIQEVYLIQDGQYGPAVAGQSLVTVFPFPKAFEGRTAIHYGPVKRWILDVLYDYELKEVPLNNPEFGKIFEVYGSDPTQSQSLLSSNFLETIIEMNKIWERGIEMEFHNGLLLVLLNCEYIFKTADLNQSAYNTDAVRKLLHEINLMFKVIEILNIGINKLAKKNIS